jgi:DinB superfamily
MTSEERSQLIERYAQGADEVARSLEGFPSDQLTAHPIPGKWSAAEIVHHLSDSESISMIRLRKLIAEENPIIYGYDQETFARALRYNSRDIAPALANFRSVRAVTTQLLKTMPESEWRRPGWHTESGAYDAETWLRIYAAHAHGHADQIRRLKEKLTA